jgi:hypothetical protein
LFGLRIGRGVKPTPPLAKLSGANTSIKSVPNKGTGSVATNSSSQKTKVNWSGADHGNPRHMQKILNKVKALIASGDYSEVYINKALKTAGLKTTGSANNRLRPDIIAIKRNGKVDIIEVRSPSQSPKQLQNKLNGMLSNIPGSSGIMLP